MYKLEKKFIYLKYFIFKVDQLIEEGKNVQEKHKSDVKGDGMKSPNNIQDSNFHLAESSMDKFRYKNDQVFTSNVNVDQMIAQESVQSDIYEADQRRAKDNASDSWPWMDPTLEFAWRKIFFFSF